MNWGSGLRVPSSAHEGTSGCPDVAPRGAASRYGVAGRSRRTRAASFSASSGRITAQ